MWARIAIVAVAGLLASCSDPQTEKKRQLQGIISWAATAEMTIDAHSTHLVPDGFALLALKRCDDEITAIQQVAAAGMAPSVIDLVQRTSASVHALIDAPGQPDSASLKRQRNDLRTARAELQTVLGSL